MVLLAIGSLLLSGCGQTKSPTSASTTLKGPITITFWNEMTGPYQPVITSEIKAFHKLHPNITVQDVVVSNDAALRPKLFSAIVAGDPPTVSEMNPPWATGFISSHALVPLSPFIRGPQGLSSTQLQDFYPSMLHGGTWPNGTQYLMPFNLSANIMFYNKTAFNAAGITHFPTTWTGFYNDSLKLSTHGRKAFAITLVHSYPFLAFFYEAGGHFVGPKGQPNPAAFAPNGPAVKALTLWTNMVDHNAAVLTSGYASDTLFGNGSSVILEATSAASPYLKQAAAGRFTIGTALMPSGLTSATALFGGYLGIFSKATPTQQLAAWEFIKFLTSTRGTVLWAEHSQGYLPVRKSAKNLMTAYLANHPAQSTALAALPNAKAEEKPAWWSQFSNQILINAIDAALLHKMTPAAAMHKAYEQVLQEQAQTGDY
jgi:ABC-type glycerol-3-phosphate transport system substrate-binding protein